MREETMYVYMSALTAVVLVTFSICGVQCTRIKRESFNECVKVTQKPIDCGVARRAAQ